jgi:uncharacterized protein (DUF1684 family)
MKYLFFFLVTIQTSSFAQSYQLHIDTYLKEYKQDFIDNPHSPLKEKDLTDLHFYQADSTFRLNGKVEILPKEKPIKIPSSSGDAQQFYRYAKVYFSIKGKDLELTLYKNEIPSVNPKYSDLLFLPFTDETNNKTSYGGGRYIDIHMKDIKDGYLILDFNKAYNPYCAYSSSYRCPVPPEENDLQIEILAGEKLYTGKHKK